MVKNNNEIGKSAHTNSAGGSGDKKRNINLSDKSPVKKRKRLVFDRTQDEHIQIIRSELTESLKDRITVSFHKNQFNVTNALELGNLLNNQDVFDNFIENATQHIVNNPKNRDNLNQYLNHIIDDHNNDSFLSSLIRTTKNQPELIDENNIHQHETKLTDFIIHTREYNDLISQQLTELIAGAILLHNAQR